MYILKNTTRLGNDTTYYIDRITPLGSNDIIIHHDDVLNIWDGAILDKNNCRDLKHDEVLNIIKEISKTKEVNKMEKTYEVAGRWINEGKISQKTLEIGYLDYEALASMLYDGMILNNELELETFLDEVPYGAWYDRYVEFLEDEDMTEDEYDSYEYFYDCLESVFQWYMVSDRDAQFLLDAGEMVIYSNELNINLWCITHFGTGWSYVYSNAKIEEVI